MNPLDFLIIAVASWRLAHILVYEDAPFKLMARFRSRSDLGGLLSCIKCSSIWCALAMWLLWQTPLQPVVIILALSGAALMLAAYTGASHS